MFELKTSHPIAVDSPDHIAPWGTARDNHTSHELLNELRVHFKKSFSLMDLGCAGGQFIIDAIDRGYTALGLEGSDYRLNNGCPNWKKYHGINLFTCDISKPFTLYYNNFPAQFKCITSWEFLEHISEDRLDTVLLNVSNHLDADGIFIGQYATTPDTESSIIACERVGVPFVELHQTVRNKEWWDDRFSYLFTQTPYPFWAGVREEGQSIRYCLRKK